MVLGSRKWFYIEIFLSGCLYLYFQKYSKNVNKKSKFHVCVVYSKKLFLKIIFSRKKLIQIVLQPFLSPGVLLYVPGTSLRWYYKFLKFPQNRDFFLDFWDFFEIFFSFFKSGQSLVFNSWIFEKKARKWSRPKIDEKLGFL